MNLLIVIALLLTSFFIHLAWWRVKSFRHDTGALLLIFFGVPSLIVCIYLANHSTSISLPTMISSLLLYTGCSLTYIILYSAIAQQSPTLLIITHISSQGDNGCDDTALRHYLSACDEIKKRLDAMMKDKWISHTNQTYQLTTKGLRIAKLFEFYAKILGLRLGG